MSEAGLAQTAKSYGVERRLDVLYEGILEHWPEGVDKVVIRGEPLTREQFAAKVAATREVWKKVREAKALIRQFAHDKPKHKATATQLLDDAKVGIASHVGLESETLTTFGFFPKRKRRALTSAQEALRVAKLRETRKARGTMGKRQREMIKFEGTDFVLRLGADGSSHIAVPAKVIPVVSSPPPVTPLTAQSAPAAEMPEAFVALTKPRTSPSSTSAPNSTAPPTTSSAPLAPRSPSAAAGEATPSPTNGTASVPSHAPSSPPPPSAPRPTEGEAPPG